MVCLSCWLFPWFGTAVPVFCGVRLLCPDALSAWVRLQIQVAFRVSHLLCRGPDCRCVLRSLVLFREVVRGSVVLILLGILSPADTCCFLRISGFCGCVAFCFSGWALVVTNLAHD